MRIMVLGAGGFLGRRIVAELLAAGHGVTGIVRRTGGLARAIPQAEFAEIDLARAVHPDDWRDRLRGIDVVVIAAGLLRGRDLHAVHVAMPAALAAAAQTAGVERIVLISAISARADVGGGYALTKLAGEQVLRESGADWTVLRPSLVYGEGSYGGTSLLRGLAALPFAVPLPAAGLHAFSPIHVHDLGQAVRRVCEDREFAGRTLEPCGPETLGLEDLLARYRAWLGFGAAHLVSVPLPAMRLLARLGDVLGDGPVSTASLTQLIAGNAGDGAAFAQAIGFAPRSLAEALRDNPAQVQDRWHARLFFLAPALRFMLVALWLASAWLGLFHGAAQTDAVVRSLGLPQGLSEPLRIGSSLLDIGVAALVALDSRARWSTAVQLGVVLGYTAALTWALPQLWLDPLGPLLKNLPILLAIAVHGAIGDRR